MLIKIISFLFFSFTDSKGGRSAEEGGAKGRKKMSLRPYAAEEDADTPVRKRVIAAVDFAPLTDDGPHDPLDYLRRFCIISEEQRRRYKKIFDVVSKKEQQEEEQQEEQEKRKKEKIVM